jgi:hypothetical protein
MPTPSPTPLPSTFPTEWVYFVQGTVALSGIYANEFNNYREIPVALRQDIALAIGVPLAAVSISSVRALAVGISVAFEVSFGDEEAAREGLHILDELDFTRTTAKGLENGFGVEVSELAIPQREAWVYPTLTPPTVSPTKTPTGAPSQHYCDSGEHPCDSLNGGCVKHGAGYHDLYDCQCVEGYDCFNGCSYPYINHECRVEDPSVGANVDGDGVADNGVDNGTDDAAIAAAVMAGFALGIAVILLCLYVVQKQNKGVNPGIAPPQMFEHQDTTRRLVSMKDGRLMSLKEGSGTADVWTADDMWRSPASVRPQTAPEVVSNLERRLSMMENAFTDAQALNVAASMVRPSTSAPAFDRQPQLLTRSVSGTGFSLSRPSRLAIIIGRCLETK